MSRSRSAGPGLFLATLVLLLVGGSTNVQAQPPPPTLCPGLHRDALTRCLYSDTDDRLRSLEPTVEPTSTPPTSPPPTTSPPPSTPASGDWLSGAAGPDAADGSFGTWRGSKVEIGQTWINSTAMSTITPTGEWGAFGGPMSISLSPPTWTGWAAEASGAHDAYWTAIGRTARQYRGSKGQVYLNPYYEFNGDWMQWSVVRTAQGMADFRAGYARTAAILRKEFPEAKLVINPGAGRTVPADMWPASSSFDVVGIDIYNEWPHCATTSCVPSFIGRIDPLQQAAKAKGKPIAFPEWGNSSTPSSGGGGGESVPVMDGFANYFQANAGTGPGQVLYETYFNIDGYPGRYELWTGQVNSQMPNTVERYRVRF